MASGQFEALADLSVPAVVVGFFKSPAAPAAGVVSIVLGVAESDTSWLAPVVGIGGGGALLILAWFANAVKKVMERWLEAQGQKLIDLPDAQALREDKKNLMDKLEDFAKAAEAERVEMQRFRITLAGTLADHGARIRNLEGKKHNTGETPRSGG